MDIEITVKKNATTIKVKLNEVGDWHVFNVKGNLVQRCEDYDTANMAVWLLDRSAEGGPFTIKEIRSQAR